MWKVSESGDDSIFASCVCVLSEQTRPVRESNVDADTLCIVRVNNYWIRAEAQEADSNGKVPNSC